MSKDLNEMIKVTNRSLGSVIYRIPEKGIRREFYPKETKMISFGEILEATSQPGGRELFYNYLLIHDAEALREGLNVKEEVEYWMSEEEIPEWMNSCSLPAFQDALDFAPEGVLELIKKYAVSMPLNDMSKRQAIQDQLFFNVTKAIENESADRPAEAGTDAPQRRVQQAPQYKVTRRAEV